MDIQLSPVEARVLACLVEKELTTPEYYPLSLNSLTLACNQKSNRDPVVSFDEKTVVRAIESLRENNLALMVTGAGSRVAKYKHSFPRRFQLRPPEVALLAVLMLRGPQTVGELRGRSARLYEFTDLTEVEAVLNGLMSRGEGAFVVKLPRQAGRKEARYAHLLAGEPEIDEEKVDAQTAGVTISAGNDALESVRNELATVRSELDELKRSFADFRKQFE